MSWLHRLDAEGSYQLMFTIWEAEHRILLRAPCPRQPLLAVNSPLSPVVAGIDPNQPKSEPARQWISIQGGNSTETSTVVLSIQGNRYPIAEERTQFVNPEQLRVLVGLTDPGTWTAQVVNVGDVRSNVFEFRVLP